MLDDAIVSELAGNVARSHLAEPGHERVLTAPTTDSAGADALLITIVLKPDAVAKLTGDNAIDIIMELRRKLEAAGDDRSPIVEYATEQELQSEEGEEEPAEEDAA